MNENTAIGEETLQNDAHTGMLKRRTLVQYAWMAPVITAAVAAPAASASTEPRLEIVSGGPGRLYFPYNQVNFTTLTPTTDDTWSVFPQIIRIHSGNTVVRNLTTDVYVEYASGLAQAPGADPYSGILPWPSHATPYHPGDGATYSAGSALQYWHSETQQSVTRRYAAAAGGASLPITTHSTFTHQTSRDDGVIIPAEGTLDIPLQYSFTPADVFPPGITLRDLPIKSVIHNPASPPPIIYFTLRVFIYGDLGLNTLVPFYIGSGKTWGFTGNNNSGGL